MKNKEMFELYSEYIGKNEEGIIEDFCNKVKNELIGDLTLNEYSRFRFWKHSLGKELSSLFLKYLKDNGVDKVPMQYDVFCEMMWNDLNSEDTKDLTSMITQMKISGVAKA